MSDQQAQKLQQQMQLSQQLQSRFGAQNGLLGSLQSRYGSALSNQNPYPNMGMSLPTPSPFNFNVQPQAPAPPPSYGPFTGSGLGGTTGPNYMGYNGAR